LNDPADHPPTGASSLALPATGISWGLCNHPGCDNYVRGAKQVRDYLKAVNHGATRDGINTEQLLGLPVAVAPPAEQRKIVAEIDKRFSRLDEAVANLQRVKANLKRYKAAVLKAAVEGRLVETEASIARREGRNYETGKQLLQRIVEERKSLSKGMRASVSAADDICQLVCPQGWAWSTCDAAIQAIDAGASFKCEERPPVGDEVGVLKVSALTWGFYDESESKTCKDAARIEEKFLVRDGDFLFSRANTIDLVGACVIVGKTTKRLMLSDKTLRFTVSTGVLPAWLQICLRCKFGRDEIERLATGNQESMRNIGQERIRQIRMPFPPHAEQTRIVAEVDRRLSVIREVEAEVDANLKRAQALRQSVLSKIFAA
jgi:type I restriction enzyme S subunit